MGERNPHDTLSKLKGRVEVMRKEHQADAEEEQKYSSAGVAFRIGIDLISGVAFGVIAGLLLDKWLDTTPWLLITFILLGTAAGIRNVIRTASKLDHSPPPKTVTDKPQDK